MRHLRSSVVVVLALALGGCGPGTSGDGPQAPAPPTQTTPLAPPAPPADVEDSGGEAMEELTGGEQHPSEPSPTWDADAERAAAERAAAFMRAFARPDLPDDDWHAGIAGFMTIQGAQEFAYVDPANVPASSVESARVLANVSASLAEVEVTTDAGTYLVTMIRTTANTPWLVEYTAPLE